MIAGQHIHILGHHIHPWLLFQDLGIIAVISLAYIFTRLFEGIVFTKFLLLFALIYLGYEKVYPRIKLLVFKTRLRSYLQDCIAYLFPAYLFGSWAMGMSVAASADLLGLMVPLLFGFVRLACFFGGCCYGVPWKYGIQYPEEMMSAKGYRRYTPSPNPGCRVVPIQLVESLVNFALFALLFWRLYVTKDLSGSTLPLYLIGYCIYRIIGDLFRKVSARPRRGPFSEAQIISFFVITASSTYLLVGGFLK